MDEMRAMLDQLMGSDRNLSSKEKELHKPKTRSFSDPDVCKYYLCGFCPFEEFRRTKNDCGECPAVHDEGCRAAWEALDDRDRERYGYERDLLRRMDRHLADLRRRIDMNTARIAAAQRPVYLAEDQAAMDDLNKQIDDLLAKAAELGEAGDVDAAEAATRAADAVGQQKAALERAADARSGNNATKGLVQSVCPVSGLIINDEESRLRDHHAGRNFNSWKKLHDVYAALKEKEDRRRGGGRGYDDRRERERERERGHRRRRSRSRSRSRDRRRRRSRSRSRSRDRHRDRRHDRDGEHRESRRGDSGEVRPAERERERERSPEEGEVLA